VHADLLVLVALQAGLVQLLGLRGAPLQQPDGRGDVEQDWRYSLCQFSATSAANVAEPR
jgi:hypothetical protein